MRIMSFLQSQSRKGYLAALVGGFGGAIVFLASSLVIAKGYITQLQSHPISAQGMSFIIGMMIGTTCAEVLGCWLALRWRKHQQPRSTAAWLTALFIPGWIVYFVLSLILGSFLSALLLFVSLPLIARAFTNNPTIPNGISRAVHTNAKRPPSY
jgi:MFS family permease